MSPATLDHLLEKFRARRQANQIGSDLWVLIAAIEGLIFFPRGAQKVKHPGIMNRIDQSHQRLGLIRQNMEQASVRSRSFIRVKSSRGDNLSRRRWRWHTLNRRWCRTLDSRRRLNRSHLPPSALFRRWNFFADW